MTSGREDGGQAPRLLSPRLRLHRQGENRSWFGHTALWSLESSPHRGRDAQARTWGLTGFSAIAQVCPELGRVREAKSWGH